jgi:hypothetical protein
VNRPVGCGPRWWALFASPFASTSFQGWLSMPTLRRVSLGVRLCLQDQYLLA